MNEQLRSALRELGDVPPPADLASGALTRARRDRRRTVVTLAVVAAVVAAVVVTVPTVLLRPGPTEPAAPTPTSWVASVRSMVGVPAGNGIESQSSLYDPATRRYRVVPGLSVLSASPDGRQAVVREVAGDRQIETVMPVSRLAAGFTAADRARPLPPGGLWRWSPDSTRLLSTVLGTVPEVVVVDVATRRADRVPLQLGQSRISPLGLDWGPGGRGFVGWAEPARAARPGPGEVVLFDVTGRPGRRLPLTSVDGLDQQANPRLDLAPGGDRALLSLPTSFGQDGQQGKSWVLDLGTGTARQLSAPNDQWYDEQHLLRIDATGPEPSSLVVTDAVTRSEVRRTTLPAVPRALITTGVVVVRGPAPPGAIII